MIQAWSQQYRFPWRLYRRSVVEYLELPEKPRESSVFVQR